MTLIQECLIENKDLPPLQNRISEYLPIKYNLDQYPVPGPDELDQRERLNKGFPGSEYILKYSPLEGKLVIVPPHHNLAKSVHTPSGDYAQLIFEGLSAEPIIEDGSIEAANLVLWEPRIGRLKRSIKGMNLNPEFNIDDFVQGIKDLISILGPDITNNGTRAYVRPHIYRAGGMAGVTPATDAIIDGGVWAWNWPDYIKKGASESGIKVVALTDAKRTSPVRAKEAAGYNRGGEFKRRKEEFDADEVIFFAPFKFDRNFPEVYESNTDEDLSDSVFSDGSGEELMLVRKDGLVLYLPMSVNRLGGTTLSSVIAYLTTEKNGYYAQESFFGPEEVFNECYSLLMLGNAAKILPVNELVVANSSNRVLQSGTLPINDKARWLIERFENELTGKVSASDPQLLTPVEFSPEAREILDGVYKYWI